MDWTTKRGLPANAGSVAADAAEDDPMLTVVLFLILLWVVAGIVGIVVHGLFWLFIVACLLLLFTLVLGAFARGRRGTRQAR